MSLFIASDYAGVRKVHAGLTEPTRKTGVASPRRVMILAGIAHVLLYNAVRVAANKKGLDTELVIAYDLENTATLDMQTPEVQAVIAEIGGTSLPANFDARSRAFYETEKSRAVPPGRSEKRVSAIWDLVLKAPDSN